MFINSQCIACMDEKIVLYNRAKRCRVSVNCSLCKELRLDNFIA